MKVLFIYRFLTAGGVEAVLRARLDGLPDFDIEADAWFLTYVDGGAILTPSEKNVFIGDLHALDRHLRARRYDLISAIDTPEVFRLLQLLEPRIPLVVEAHTPYLENLTYLDSIDSALVRAVLVPSRYQRDVVENRLGLATPVMVVPNPLREVFFDDLSDAAASPERPIVGWIGRLDNLKNWRAYMRLAGGLLKQGRKVDCWLVARPPHQQAASELYRFAVKTGTLARLRWWSTFPHSRMPALLDMIRSSGGVLVSTSRGESFGLAVAEAMARACAVVVPARGPFPEIVNDGETGLLYGSGSIREALEAVGRLLDDATLRKRIGTQARSAANKRFAPRVALARLSRVLTEIADRAVVVSQSLLRCDDGIVRPS